MKKIKIALVACAVIAVAFELAVIFRPAPRSVGLFDPPITGDSMFYHPDGSTTSNYQTRFVAITNRILRHRAEIPR